MDADVVIIGAGYAGLTAARTLSRANVATILLDASGRVGGRALTDREGDAPIDLGGQWIGAAHDRLLTHASEASLGTFRSPTAGDDLVIDRGRLLRGATVPAPLVPHLVTALPALAGISAARRRLTAARARRWDRTSVADFVHRTVPSAVARRVLATAIRVQLCLEPGDVTMLSLARALRETGGIRSALAFEGGAQQDLFVDGADALAHRWSADLDVRLETPVTAVERAGATMRVRARSDAGPEILTARHVVVATGPSAALGLTFAPALPLSRSATLRGTSTGRVVKTVAVYDTPFWREEGLSGTLTMTGGPATFVADVTPPGGPGHLCVIAAGNDPIARAGLGSEDRRSMVLAVLARAFGRRAMRPARVVERNWAEDPWSEGGYGAAYAAGTGARSPARPATPGISWAGTEHSPRWARYLEGAVTSGERTAVEVLTALGRA